MKTIMILPGCTDSSAKEMFRRRGYNAFIYQGDVEGFSNVNPDAVCFMGGVDVNPAVYGEEMGETTQYPNVARDEFEIAAFNYFSKQGALLLGICRGAQLLNVLNGGKMIQECGYRGGVDWMKTEDGLIPHEVCHHQGIICTDEAYRHGFDVEEELDYLFYYGKTRSLGIQGHPEWGNKETEDSFFGMIDTYSGWKEELCAA